MEIVHVLNYVLLVLTFLNKPKLSSVYSFPLLLGIVLLE